MIKSAQGVLGAMTTVRRQPQGAGHRLRNRRFHDSPLGQPEFFVPLVNLRASTMCTPVRNQSPQKAMSVILSQYTGTTGFTHIS